MNANYSSKARLGKMAIRGCKWIAAVLLIMACSLVGGTAPVELGAPTLPQSEITFKLSIPQNTPGGALIQINLLDEVTGLPYNKQSMTMQVLDAHHYQVTLRAAVGSVIKYRYTRVFDGLPILEHTPGGQPVRYRMYYVDGPGEVSDIVSRWSDTLPEGGQGRLVGKALDAESGQPVPNLMVTAGGVQVFTAANGEFRIEGLPPGTHQVTGYAVDGSYRPFKQGALVAENAATPVNIQANPAPLVVVRFNVSVPEETVPTVPVRLAGNLVQLGNTFSDWGGGTSTLAGRMPVMEALGGGKYEIQMILTAGTYLRYKYTMGDGFWNAEQNSAGRFVVREAIIPEGVSEVRIDDRVLSWNNPDAAATWFDVVVPANTAQTEQIYVQYKRLGWMEPIPMWPAGENRWGLQLTSPTNIDGEFEYRYCRNGQCGDENSMAVELSAEPRKVTTNNDDVQTLTDKVTSWQWFDPGAGPARETAEGASQREAGFSAGIEMIAGYHPSWDAYWPRVYEDVQSLGANWVILSPSWTWTHQNPPLLAQAPNGDMLWQDAVQMVQTAKAKGLHVALFPQPNFTMARSAWWQTAQRDFSWWLVWFESYSHYARHFAALAQNEGADSLILGGGPWLDPALPDGKLADGSSSNVPGDASGRWSQLLADVRAVYDGKIVWALNYPQGVANPPQFLKDVDEIVVLWGVGLAEVDNAGVAEMKARAEVLLDADIRPLQQKWGKPVILSVAFPAINGGTTNCVPLPQGGCLQAATISPLMPNIPGVTLDLQEQADAYRAVLEAVNARGWISGFFSRGYYPPVVLRDKSISIHGKPAAEVLRAWFMAWLGGG